GTPRYAESELLCGVRRSIAADRLACLAARAFVCAVCAPARNFCRVSWITTYHSDCCRRLRFRPLPATSATAADHSAAGELTVAGQSGGVTGNRKLAA